MEQKLPFLPHDSSRYSLYPRPKAWDTAAIGATNSRLYFQFEFILCTVSLNLFQILGVFSAIPILFSCNNYMLGKNNFSQWLGIKYYLLYLYSILNQAK